VALAVQPPSHHGLQPEEDPVSRIVMTMRVSARTDATAGDRARWRRPTLQTTRIGSGSAARQMHGAKASCTRRRRISSSGDTGTLSTFRSPESGQRKNETGGGTGDGAAAVAPPAASTQLEPQALRWFHQQRAAHRRLRGVAAWMTRRRTKAGLRRGQFLRRWSAAERPRRPH